MGVTFPYHGKLPFECSDALHRQVPCYLKSASMSAVVETVDYVRWQLHLGRSYIDMPSRDPIPVSYTHLDVYKRQGPHTAVERR